MNWRAVAALKLAADQEDLVADNLYSIAESQFDKTARPRAICAGKRVVGFLMYDVSRARGKLRKALIYRFMIDARQQGNFEQARKAYEKALQLDPKNMMIRQNYDLFKEINDRAKRRSGGTAQSIDSGDSGTPLCRGSYSRSVPTPCAA